MLCNIVSLFWACRLARTYRLPVGNPHFVPDSELSGEVQRPVALERQALAPRDPAHDGQAPANRNPGNL